jgi:hypothetical protein
VLIDDNGALIGTVTAAEVVARIEAHLASRRDESVVSGG